MTALLIIVAWWLVLVVWVMLKVRQPKWVRPWSPTPVLVERDEAA